MRKTARLIISMSAALFILGLFSAGKGTSVVMAQAKGTGLLAAKTDASGSLNSALQGAPFIWAAPDEERDYPGYRRVEGGKHQDGTTMYICKDNFVPGKLYQNKCYSSYGGREHVDTKIYRVLVTNVPYQWKSSDNTSRAQIKSGAVKVGIDRGQDSIYICRKQMSDGLHPGKYSYNNHLCYIPWGGKEYFYAQGYEILFP